MRHIYKLCEGGRVAPKQILADPFKMVWHLALGQKGVAPIDLQSTLRLIYSQSIVQLKCSV